VEADKETKRLMRDLDHDSTGSEDSTSDTRPEGKHLV
jgi:hypothetical protein